MVCAIGCLAAGEAAFDASVVSALKEALAEAARGLVDREALVELVALGAVSGEHLLVVGPPGTAKSEAVRRVARVMGGSYFEYLLGRFTEPSELFGPIDLRKLRDGIVETETTGMLPEADVAFLDEVFHGSSAILNTLLGILNERWFRRGHTAVRCPLRVCVGATNTLPEDETLLAFGDRFLLRIFVDAVSDPLLEDLLEGGWNLAQRDLPVVGLDVLDGLASRARALDMAPIRPSLAHAIRTLRAHGIRISDRRAVRLQRVVAAAAVIAGRDRATDADLWPIVYAVPDEASQRLARDVLRELLANSENDVLPAAAEEASLGPRARANRLAAAGLALLAAPVEGEGAGAWRLELEGVAREIDAGFDTADLDAELAAVRARIVVVLGHEDERIIELAGDVAS